jgi:hypothetical protein
VSGVAAPLAGAVEPRVLGERHEGGRGQALRGACDHPLNHAAIFLFAPPRGHHRVHYTYRPSEDRGIGNPAPEPDALSRALEG